MERKGIRTERGDINREIRERNSRFEQAKEELEAAKQEVRSARYARIRNAIANAKNEVLEMIAKVAERKGRLDLPIVSGKHLRRISNRAALQSADNAEKFITSRKIDSFESLAAFTADRERMYKLLNEGRQQNKMQSRGKRREEEI